MPISRKKPHFDVLLLTAVEDEYKQVARIVPDFPSTGWVFITDSRGRHMMHGSFKGDGERQPLTVLVACALNMGLVSAILRVFELALEFQFEGLAMCGVCAAESKINPGNVLVARSTWWRGPGKSVINSEGKEDREESLQNEYFFPSEFCIQAAEYGTVFANAFKERLASLYPSNDPNGKFDNFKVQVVDYITVPDVILDPGIFKRTDSSKESESKRLVVKNINRAIRALEMESFAIPLAAKTLNLKYCFLAKGVQDHAQVAPEGNDKNDMYREFSAYASALFTIEFLRNYCPLLFGNKRTASISGKTTGSGSIKVIRKIKGEWQFPSKPIEYEMRHITLTLTRKIGEDVGWFHKKFHRPAIPISIEIKVKGDEIRSSSHLFAFDTQAGIFAPSPIEGRDGNLCVDEGHSHICQVLNTELGNKESGERCLKSLKKSII